MRPRFKRVYLLVDASLVMAPTPSRARSRACRRSVTLWWIIFNNPEACRAHPGSDARCGAVDIYGQADLDSVAAGIPDSRLITPNRGARLGVLFATGSVTRANRDVWMTASIYRSSAGLTLPGPNLIDPLGLGVGYENPEAEVHLVLRDHGPRVRGQEIAQTTIFLDPSCSDPSREFFAGRNICADVQFAIIAPREQGSDSVYACDRPVSPVPYAEAQLFRNGDALVATCESHVAR